MSDLNLDERDFWEVTGTRDDSHTDNSIRGFAKLYEGWPLRAVMTEMKHYQDNGWLVRIEGKYTGTIAVLNPRRARNKVTIE